MKTNPSEEKDPLQGLLHEWQVTESLPPRFQERVWQRIAAAEAESPLRVSAVRGISWLTSFLSRPGLAVGYVTALLVVGFGVGWARGMEKSARLDQDLSARYVRKIDPYYGMER